MKNKDIKKNERIKQAIIEVVAFFDLFKKPLTLSEIWQFINVKATPGEVLGVLESGIEKIEKKDAFYFIKGKSGLVQAIPEQQNLIYQKFKIAKWAATILRFVSGVKMVGVCNNFYYNKDSDVDVFIIVKAKRMWLTRLLVTVVIHLFGLRRYGSKIKNRICLSFYVTEDHLSLRSITIKPLDPYFYFWLVYLFPIYDDGIYNEFMKNNSWLKEKLPNMVLQIPSRQKQVLDNPFSIVMKKINWFWFDSSLGDMLERTIRKIQLRRMAKNNNSLACKDDSRVIISDVILKFHENDRRQDIINQLKDFRHV